MNTGEDHIFQLVKAMPHPAALVDATGKILYSNYFFHHYIRGSLEGDELQSFVHLHGGDIMEAVAGLQQPFLPEVHTHMGYTTPVLCIRDQQRPAFILVFYELPRVKEESIAQKYAHQIFNELNSGLIIVDHELKIVEISQYACNVLGLDKYDVIGKTFREIFPEVHDEDLIVPPALANGITEKNKAFTWSANGKTYDLLLDSHLIHDESGKLVGAYILFKDVSNLRSIDEKIQRNDRLAMIGQIAAGTAHEIRNPLTSIRGFLQILRGSLERNGMEKEKGFVELMLTEIQRINSLVDQFLLLSKPRNVQYRPINLNEVLREIIPIVQNEAILYNVEIVDQTNNELPVIIGDSELMKQVFLNICKNGMEAIGKNGKVTITHEYDRKEKKVIINIHDTGPGIPTYIIDRIFDPFFTTKEEGTGLGLSVCQRIVQDIGGSIRVSSKGYGTTFQIILPYLS